jgi:uncharacterized SAM-binding protein YcdF (DUF218 family)
MIQRRHMTIIAVFLLIGVGLLLAYSPILSAIGNYLVIDDDLTSADIIHVIAGPDHRADHAIQLYKQGYGRRLFFTGGWCQKHQQNHGERGIERATEQNIPLNVIAVDESPVTSTYAEATRLKQFIDHDQIAIHSVIVVSDPYHMRRARWAFRNVLGDQIVVKMAPVPFELSNYNRRWWTDKKSWRMVKREYLKCVYYYARYQLSWGPIKRWLESLDKE